jgi:hypothetical protein
MEGRGAEQVDSSGMMMREAAVAPRRLEKGAAEKLKRDNRINSRTSKQFIMGAREVRSMVH